MRTKGAKNVVRFEKRLTVETSDSRQIRHLAEIRGNPLKEFTRLLEHQVNFLDWIEDRHDKIVSLREEVMRLEGAPKGKGPVGAKEMTFVKYRWYSEHLVLLEAINGFETFYKKTFISLGEALQEYVQPESEDPREQRISTNVLWSITGDISIPALVFEHRLFHDLNAVDAACQFLVGKRRYNQNSHNNPLADRVRALRAIFQVRHTLSHNGGLITTSDASKFALVRFKVTKNEVIDPTRNHFGVSLFRELRAEASEFTAWLAVATAQFLTVCVHERGLAVSRSLKKDLEGVLGPSSAWASVPWS